MFKTIFFYFLIFLFFSGFSLFDRTSEYIEKGIAEYKKKNYSAASSEFEKAYLLSPENDIVLFNLATAFVSAGSDISFAKKRFDELLKKSGISFDIRAKTFFNLGVLAFEQSEYEQAKEYFKYALKIYPNWQKAKYNYEYTYMLTEQRNNNIASMKNEKDKNEEQTDLKNNSVKKKSSNHKSGSSEIDNNLQNNKNNNSYDNNKNPKIIDNQNAEQILNTIKKNNSNFIYSFLTAPNNKKLGVSTKKW